MRTNLLKSKMVEKSITGRELSQVLSMTPTTFSHKLNGKVDLSLGEAVKISNELDLTAEEISAIFFDRNISNMRLYTE